MIDRRGFSQACLTILLAGLCQCSLADQQAKHVILLIGDGMGYNSVEAASYFQYGELGKQSYDQFPVRMSATTYMLNYVNAAGKVLPASIGKTPKGAVGAQPQGYDPDYAWETLGNLNRGKNYTVFTDSAASATAMYTGQKTTNGRMGTSWNGEEPLRTIAQIADRAGKRTGVVTSVQTSHATPGALWSHHTSRNDYAVIFRRLINESKLNVIFGAGHPYYNNDGKQQFDNDGNPKPIDFKYVGGPEQWEALCSGKTEFSLIETKQQFEELAEATAAIPDRVVGIAQVHKTLQCYREGKDTAPKCPLNSNVPSLKTMTQAAINVLSQDEQGFLLVVEGGAIDWANHDNHLGRLIEEMVDFNQTVESVVRWVEENSNWDETLVIVTADHECGMLWGPQTYRDLNSNEKYDEGTDTFYGWQRIGNNGIGQLPEARYASGGHTNALAPLYAQGVASDQFLHRIQGTDTRAAEFWRLSTGDYVDNTDIFHVMKAAIAP